MRIKEKATMLDSAHCLAMSSSSLHPVIPVFFVRATDIVLAYQTFLHYRIRGSTNLARIIIQQSNIHIFFFVLSQDG